MCQGFKGFLRRNLVDMKARITWQGALAELLGTAILILVGCGTCLGKDWEANNPTILQISLTFGLAVATVVRCIGHVSGGHINPAVTCAMLITRRVTLFKALLYVVAQCLGAIMGAGLLRVVTPVPYEGDLGQTSVSNLMSPFPGAFLVESTITFILVFTVFASCDANRQDLSGSTPLSIGFAVAFCHMFAIKYTGSSMNPARTFGPAVAGGNWENHWIYWCGPIAGGVIAGLLYEFLFASNATPIKVKMFFVDSRYWGDKIFVQAQNPEDMYNEENKALNDKV